MRCRAVSACNCVTLAYSDACSCTISNNTIGYSITWSRRCCSIPAAEMKPSAVVTGAALTGAKQYLLLRLHLIQQTLIFWNVSFLSSYTLTKLKNLTNYNTIQFFNLSKCSASLLGLIRKYFLLRSQEIGPFQFKKNLYCSLPA